MPPDASDPDAAHTVELAVVHTPASLPAIAGDLRDHLPGLETERWMTDWGRSERVEAVADHLYEFLYRYWFRAEVEGIENVPSQGPALLLSNHAGAIPVDGAMISKAIREEHSRPRPVQLLTEGSLAAVPVLGMLATKLGRVSAHPANLRRLLADEHELVLAFPEGRAGPAKVLKERYRLRPFDGGRLVAAALEARAPIVPVAVLGAEETLPVVARINLLGRITRLADVPIAAPIPLPAKFRIRFLEPIVSERVAPAACREEGQARGLTDEIRALIQENLLELVAERRNPWLG